MKKLIQVLMVFGLVGMIFVGCGENKSTSVIWCEQEVTLKLASGLYDKRDGMGGRYLELAIGDEDFWVEQFEMWSNRLDAAYKACRNYDSLDQLINEDGLIDLDENNPKASEFFKLAEKFMKERKKEMKAANEKLGK